MNTNTTTKNPKAAGREYCQCCHRPLPQERVERLTPKLCDALRRISKNSREGAVFVRVPAYEFKGLHARLRHWGLIEEQTYVRKNGSEARRPGCWRITKKGLEFLAGDLFVPGILVMEEDRPIGSRNPQVNLALAEAGAALSPKDKKKAEEAQAEADYLREQSAKERSYLNDEE